MVNTPLDMKIINKFLFVTIVWNGPGGKDNADELLNIIGDNIYFHNGVDYGNAI